MRNIFILGAAFTLILISCHSEAMDFDIIDSKGLDTGNLSLKTILFCNEDTGFIAGSLDKVTQNADQSSNQFAFVDRLALMYRTTDEGRTWEKKEFGRGYFTKIIEIEDVIFAFKKSDDYSHDFIYSSRDLGATWNEVFSFPAGTYDLLSTADYLCAVAADSAGKETYLFFSGDGGGSWSEAYRLDSSPFASPIKYGDKILFLINSGQGDYFPNGLVVYDPRSNMNELTMLPSGFSCYFLTNYNGEIELTGLKDGHISVYSFRGKGLISYEYSCRNSGHLFPQGYYCNNGKAWFIAGKRSESDVSNVILKTEDRGKGWKVIRFEKEKYIKPFCFLENKGRVKAWFYSGSGMFQMLEEK